MREKTVNARTELYAILGNPIAHSMSPVIMNSQFDRMDMDKVFLAFKADRDTFPEVMNTSIKIGLKGYVFTMPIKEAAVSFMDELSSEAELIGAVNCAMNNNGRLIGYNTDSIGFWQALKRKKSGDCLPHKVFVLGMGGMARAAVAQAAIQGVKEIVVANPLSDTAFVESFRQFLARLEAAYPSVQVRIIDWDTALWVPEFTNCQIVANATPNGMYGNGDLHETFRFDAVEQGCVFFDAIYEPRITKFLAHAQQLGFPIVEGIDLLVHQGTCSFFNWTGIDADPAQMKENILNFMECKT